MKKADLDNFNYLISKTKTVEDEIRDCIKQLASYERMYDIDYYSLIEEIKKIRAKYVCACLEASEIARFASFDENNGGIAFQIICKGCTVCFAQMDEDFVIYRCTCYEDDSDVVVSISTIAKILQNVAEYLNACVLSHHISSISCKVSDNVYIILEKFFKLHKWGNEKPKCSRCGKKL